MTLLTVDNPFKGTIDWAATPGGVGPNRYPFDLAPSERHTRFPINHTFWPSFNWLMSRFSAIKDVAPAMLVVPMSQGFLPQFDLATWQMAFGKRAYGPGVNANPGTQSFTRFPNIVFPTLPKETESNPAIRT